MGKIKTLIFKTIAVIAFVGLTIGGSAVTSRANDYGGSGVPEEHGTTDTTTTGSGSGGSTDTGTTDTGTSYRNDYQEGTGYRNNNQEGTSYRNNNQEGTSGSSAGSGSGGSTDTGSYSGSRLRGTGPNYGTAPLGGPSGNGLGDPR